jgi:hypothetical protein
VGLNRRAGRRPREGDRSQDGGAAGPAAPPAGATTSTPAVPVAPATSGSAAAAGVSTGPASSDPADDGIAVRPILWTTIICVLTAVIAHTLIYLGFAFEWTEDPDPDFAWQPVVGVALTVVAIGAFGGFYVASRRARIAIAAAFLLTFLVSLTFVLTIEGLANATQLLGARDLFDDFRNIVAVIIGFYFGTEAAISVAKVIGVSLTNRGADTEGARTAAAAIRRADRDLAPPASQG